MWSIGGISRLKILSWHLKNRLELKFQNIFLIDHCPFMSPSQLSNYCSVNHVPPTLAYFHPEILDALEHMCKEGGPKSLGKV